MRTPPGVVLASGRIEGKGRHHLFILLHHEAALPAAALLPTPQPIEQTPLKAGAQTARALELVAERCVDQRRRLQAVSIAVRLNVQHIHLD